MAELNNSSTGKWSETDASNTSPSPDGWPSGTFLNQVEPIGRSTMGAIKRFWDRINGTVTSGGSSNAYTYTPANTAYPTSYIQGETYTFLSNFANTGAATLNINGLGAKNIYISGPNGPQALTGGEIQNGQMVMVAYDGTEFQLLSPTAPTVTSQGLGSGLVNKFINPEFTIQQRGSSGTVASGGSSYALDRWQVFSSGGTISWAQGGTHGLVTPGYGLTDGSISLTGASGITQCGILQRIESSVAAPLSGQPCVLQFTIGNNTGSTITPTFRTAYPSSKDSWGSINYDQTGTFQSIPNGQQITVAFSFYGSTNAYLGLQIELFFGTSLGSGSSEVYVCAADVRAVAGLGYGIQISNPPVPERRPYPLELMMCQRYYEAQTDTTVCFQGSLSGSSHTAWPIGTVIYKVTKRIIPTVTQIIGTTTGVIFSNPSITQNGTQSFVAAANTAGTGDWYYNLTWTSSAEL